MYFYTDVCFYATDLINEILKEFYIEDEEQYPDIDMSSILPINRRIDIMDIYIEELEPGCIPVKFNKFDAGYDICSRKNIVIKPNETKRIPCGFKIGINPNWVMKIVDRSSMAFLEGLKVVDAPAIIDSGYINEICCTMKNVATDSYEIQKYDRIAQVLFEQTYQVQFLKCNSIRDNVNYIRLTRNGRTGLGSTGRGG